MKKWIIGFLALTLFVSLYLYLGNDMKKDDVLKVGFPVYWGKLIPSLQHTGYADALMGNQYEALVAAGKGGTTKPLAAKNWTVSEDFKVFTFKLDPDRYFSNGVKLTASHFKKSWEYGLKLNPKSSNSSLQDVTYKMVGYDEFKTTGKLSGVTVIDNETLRVEFKESFRMALNYLAGSRMSAFVKEDERYLGTGPYILNDKNSILYLTRNKYSKEDIGFNNIEIAVIPPAEASSALISGKIDIYSFAELANIHKCFESGDLIDCYSGSEAQHRSLMLNGMKDRFFANRKFRLAIQSLVLKKLTEDILPSYYKYNLTIDPQIYLPLQTGRLSDEKADDLINNGDKYIVEFIKATQENPLYMITSEETNWIQELLEKEGVKFSEKSGFISTPDRVKMYYKTFEADILVLGFSVASGDPDGIYHALGKNGSIVSPIQYKESISNLLEKGRHILDLKKTDTHYQMVSAEALREVPFIHLGFSKTIVAYKNDRIKVKAKHKNRDDSRLSIYEAF